MPRHECSYPDGDVYIDLQVLYNFHIVAAVMSFDCAGRYFESTEFACRVSPRSRKRPLIFILRSQGWLSLSPRWGRSRYAVVLLS